MPLKQIRFPRFHPAAVRAAWIAAGAAVVLCVLVLFWPWRVHAPGRQADVTIGRGLTHADVARLLGQHGCIRSALLFMACGRLLGWSDDLKAGRYRFQGWENNFSVLRRLVLGQTLFEKITFPEGIRAVQIAGLLQRNAGLDSTEIMGLVRNPDLCRRLGVEASTLEGYLYPDTYWYETMERTDGILQRMVTRFNGIVSDSLRQLAQSRGWTIHELVTLASIVEGEVQLDSERTMVAAVFINRLKKGLPLQACATVQYLLPGGPRRLLERDLRIDSPYNTYLYPGLPPGPVNNPGIRSIRAVLHPALTPFLYFVANGDGSHTFSRTLDEHNAAKRRFNQIRNKVNQSRKTGVR